MLSYIILYIEDADSSIADGRLHDSSARQHLQTMINILQQEG